MEQKLYGGIELGGTKTICAIGDGTSKPVAQTVIPTTTVKETLEAIYRFFGANDSVSAVGVGAFGPLNLNHSSTAYGSLYNTPKQGWAHVELKKLLEGHFKLPVAIDLDVNCAALGELHYGVARNLNTFVYLTLGTGIGGSLIISKQLFHGLLNLEMGHMRVPHEPFADTFKGSCAFHGDCLEGVASGYAMQARHGKKAEDISDSEAWEKEAAYIAAALNNIMMTIGPEKIVLGGGLINHAGLIENIRQAVADNVNGYMTFPDLDGYIVKSSGDLNGVLGAIKLANL